MCPCILVYGQLHRLLKITWIQRQFGTGQVRLGEVGDWSNLDKLRQDGSSWDRSDQDGSSQIRSGQDKSSQNKSSQGNSSQLKTGQQTTVMTGQIMTGQVR